MKMTVIVVGKHLGEASGWSNTGPMEVTFRDFEATSNTLFCDELKVDFYRGNISLINHGHVTEIIPFEEWSSYTKTFMNFYKNDEIRNEWLTKMERKV